MQRVLVLNADKTPLMPCHPARARALLRQRKGAVYRRAPFTIILKEQRNDAVTQPLELKLDPGSKTTGIALTPGFAKRGLTVVWAANLQHRGHSNRYIMADQNSFIKTQMPNRHRHN